jgi:hypothetical protein
MADDTAEFVRRAGYRACRFGWRMGAGIACDPAPGARPKARGRLIAYDKEGFHADIVENIESTDAEDFAGSIFQEAYAKVAPNPQN